MIQPSFIFSCFRDSGDCCPDSASERAILSVMEVVTLLTTPVMFSLTWARTPLLASTLYSRMYRPWLLFSTTVTTCQATIS